MFSVAKNDFNKNEDDRQPLDQMRLIAMDDHDRAFFKMNRHLDLIVGFRSNDCEMSKVPPKDAISTVIIILMDDADHFT